MFAGSSSVIPALAKIALKRGVHAPPRAVDVSLQMVAMWCISIQGALPPLPRAAMATAFAGSVMLTPSVVTAISCTAPSAGREIPACPSACMAT